MKHTHSSTMKCLALLFAIAAAADAASAAELRASVTIDRGQDLGQCFGSLFEGTTSDKSFVVGAGFQNAYNTRYRADRHAVQFFIRPTNGRRDMQVEELPRPTDNLVGAYIFERDGAVYSTYGGLQTWNRQARTWDQADGKGGTSETMRVGNGVLSFGESRVTWNDKPIIEPPSKGS